MHSRFILLFTFIFSLNLSTSSTLYAHAGVDHGDNCFVDIGGVSLRLGGFQSEEKIGGGKHYCHLFPATGTVIYTFEQDVVAQLNKKMNLKFVGIKSYSDLILNYDQAFTQALAQVDDGSTIEHKFPETGLYALEVSLQSNELEPSSNNTQRFLFLVGFPVIKMLVYTALGFLLMLVFILLSKLKSGVRPRDL